MGPFSYKTIMSLYGLINDHPLYREVIYSARRRERSHLQYQNTSTRPAQRRRNQREEQVIPLAFHIIKISGRFIYQQPIKQFTTSLHKSASTLRDEENGHNYSIKSTSTRRAQGRRNRRKNKSYLWPVISLKISIIFVYKQSKGVRRSTPWQFKLCITG